MTDHPRDTFPAEYVLGLLEGTELARARALAVEDEDFRREIGFWSVRLAPLLDQFDSAEPPASVWRSVESKLSLRPAQSNVVALRRRVSVWQAVAGGSTAIAASLALFLVTSPGRQDQQPQVPPTLPQPVSEPMVAMLASDRGDPQMFATWDPALRRLVVMAAAPATTPEGRAHELWLIGADGQPRSMGVMPERESMTLQLDAPIADKLGEGVTLAVSDEPAGGSPTGTPTGPVIATGKLQRT